MIRDIHRAAPRAGSRRRPLLALAGLAAALSCTPSDPGGRSGSGGASGADGGRVDVGSDGQVTDEARGGDAGATGGGGGSGGKDVGGGEVGVCPPVMGPAASTTSPCGVGELGALPAGYVACGEENDSCDVPGLSHVAYGADGSFVFRYYVTGSIVLGNSVFGDPAPGVTKKGYYKLVEANESTAPLATALAHVQRHLLGCTRLTAAQLNQQRRLLDEQGHLLAREPALIQTAVAIIRNYETTNGPLFLTAKTPPRFKACSTTEDGLELARVIFSLQQGLHDVLHGELLEAHPELFDGVGYATAAYFPGAVAPPADSTVSYTVSVDASMAKDWGQRTAFSQTPRRRPTGYYLAPGSIGKVTVPPSMVSKGYQLLVGAHSWFKSGRERFAQVTKTYPITKTVTRIANPFGGGVYLIVPYQATGGVVSLGLTNVVPAPYYAQTSVRTTTLQDWTTTQRKAPAPWADFETDKFMMQVPTSWISNFADPVSLMARWDSAMDGVSELLGYPLVRNNVVLYVQTDVSIMYGVYGIGYPQANNTYDPRQPEDGDKDHWFLRDPMGGGADTEFHETGHAQGGVSFSGEGESIIHLLYAYAANVKFGASLDAANSLSMSDGQRTPVVTRDQIAVKWMVRENFRRGNPMDITGSTTDEVQYQLKGHAKYIEIVALFGWDVLKRSNRQDNLDFEAGVTPNGGLQPDDRRILRLSTFAGVDLRPLFHFWGRPPTNPTALANAIAAAGLPSSPLIRDRLLHYRTLIPMNNAQFRAHYLSLYPTQPDGESPDYGTGWYKVWSTQYNASHGTAAVAALDAIVARYFP